MYVKKLFYDDYSDPYDFEKVIDSPCWEDVESILIRLNGKTTTQIILSHSDADNYCCVGGGNESKYNVFISMDDNMMTWNLINPNGISGKNCCLVTGGQSSEFDERICVNLETAIQAVKYYFENGNKCVDLVWE